MQKANKVADKLKTQLTLALKGEDIGFFRVSPNTSSKNINGQANEGNFVDRYIQTEYCAEIDRIPIARLSASNLKPRGKTRTL